MALIRPLQPVGETLATAQQQVAGDEQRERASMQGKGASLVEIVSTCSSGWKLTPVKANEWMRENMFDAYHKGDLKDTTNL